MTATGSKFWSGTYPADSLRIVSELTRGDLIPFWSAISQLVPVLALAFVLEARMIVRRLSRKSEFQRRKTRVAWAFTFLALSVLLVMAELAALQSLASDAAAPVSPAGMFYLYATLVAITVALFIVLTVPVSSLVVASTVDANRWLAMHLPWSKAQRARHRLKLIEARAERSLVGQTSFRLNLLIAAADGLLAPPSHAEIEQLVKDTRHGLDELRRADCDPDHHKRLQGLEDLLAPPHGADLAYRIPRWLHSFAVTQEQSMLENLDQTRDLQQELDEIIETVPKEYAARIRKVMAEAARTS